MAHFEALLPTNWKSQLDEWLHEDIPSFDYGGFVVGNKAERAEIVCKQSGVICGVYFLNHVFSALDCKITWEVSEGDAIDVSLFNGRRPVAYIDGPAYKILQGERVGLNLMARASGIATRARKARQIAEKAGWKGYVAGTRKTTPGFRLVEKYSLLVGGVDTHRHDLSSMVMLKDNHIQSVGNITEAVKKARSVAGFSLKIEVECQNQAEAEEALAAGAEIVMLDNHNPQELVAPSKALKEKFPHSLIEASGGITLETLEAYMLPTVDIISLGSLTQSVNHIDFSLNIGAKTTLAEKK